MTVWERPGKSDEWYTPKYVFEALGCAFDLDPANAAPYGGNVPCLQRYDRDGLTLPWFGFVWLNPPFGGRNGLQPWIEKFFAHGNGVLLVPDRTSAPWFHDCAKRASAVLFVAGRIKFQKPDGTFGNNPSNGTALFSAGEKGRQALLNASRAGLGCVAEIKAATYSAATASAAA